MSWKPWGATGPGTRSGRIVDLVRNYHSCIHNHDLKGIMLGNVFPAAGLLLFQLKVLAKSVRRSYGQLAVQAIRDPPTLRIFCNSFFPLSGVGPGTVPFPRLGGDIRGRIS